MALFRKKDNLSYAGLGSTPRGPRAKIRPRTRGGRGRGGGRRSAGDRPPSGPEGGGVPADDEGGAP